MKDYSYLIGQTYRNGPDGVIRFKVTKVDSELPELVHYENLSTRRTGCAMAAFVQSAIDDEQKELKEMVA